MKNLKAAYNALVENRTEETRAAWRDACEEIRAAHEALRDAYRATVGGTPAEAMKTPEPVERIATPEEVRAEMVAQAEREKAAITEIERIQDERHAAISAWRQAIRNGETPEETPEQINARYMEQEITASAAACDARLRVKILTDNYRQAVAAQVMPILAEVLAKYNGKPYGEKTRQKIAEAVAERADGCRAYLEGDKISLYPRRSPIPAHSNFDIYTAADEEQWKAGGAYRRQVIDNGNKIRPEALEGWRLSYCADYVPDVAARAAEIAAAWNAYRAEFEKLKKAADALNELLPTTISRLYGNNLDRARLF